MSLVRSIAAIVSAAALALTLSIAALTVGVIAAHAHSASAEAAVSVDARLGQSLIPAEGGKVYLHVGLKALRREIEGDRTPVNVALVLDRSGSMRGDRLASAKEAAREAISRLGPEDFAALIAYNHKVDVLSSATRVADHGELTDALRRLTAQGRTALYAGVVEGGRQVERYLGEDRVNRVILLSDGQANVGPSKPRDLAKLGQKLAGAGMSVTTIGLGLNYNEDLMQRLALASDGNHAFAESPRDLVDIFNSEFGDTLSIAAQDLEIIIEVRSGFKPTRLLGRGGDIEGQQVRVKLSQLTGGAERYLIVELDAEAGAESAGSERVADVSVSYFDLSTKARDTRRAEIHASRAADKSRVEASLDATIMAKVTEQKASLVTEEAVALRDAGDVVGARALLERNAIELEDATASLGLSGAAPAAIQRLGRLRADSRRAAKNLDTENWAKTRKEMRYQQHKAKRQQTY